jgi:hypothetical protein
VPISRAHLHWNFTPCRFILRDSHTLTPQGAEPFLRSSQFLSYSKNSSSLSQINPVLNLPFYSFKIPLNITLNNTLVFQVGSILSRFCTKNSVCVPLLPSTSHMPGSSHPTGFDHPNNIWKGMQTPHHASCFSPCYCFPLGPNIFLHGLHHTNHTVLIH